MNGLEGRVSWRFQGPGANLLADADAGGPGFRASQSGRLVSEADRSLLRGEGDPVPVIDLVDGAIEDALRQRVKVEGGV